MPDRSSRLLGQNLMVGALAPREKRLRVFYLTNAGISLRRDFGELRVPVARLGHVAEASAARAAP